MSMRSKQIIAAPVNCYAQTHAHAGLYTRCMRLLDFTCRSKLFLGMIVEVIKSFDTKNAFSDQTFQGITNWLGVNQSVVAIDLLRRLVWNTC